MVRLLVVVTIAPGALGTVSQLGGRVARGVQMTSTAVVLLRLLYPGKLTSESDYTGIWIDDDIFGRTVNSNSC